MKPHITLLFTLFLIIITTQVLAKSKIKNCIDVNDRTGSNYQGKENKPQRASKSNKKLKCLKWSQVGKKLKKKINQVSYDKNIKDIEELDGHANHNYCRNPDGSAYPWCYVDPKQLKLGKNNWDYCKPIKPCKNAMEQQSEENANEKEPMCGMSCQQGFKECTFDLSKDVEKGKENPGSRMFNAIAAKPGEFPWMASLYDPCYMTAKKKRCKEKQNNKGGVVFCGASILNRHWILTAAHCIINPHSGKNNYKTFEKNGKKDVTRVIALVGYQDWHTTPDRTGNEHKFRQRAMGRDEIPIYQFISHKNYDSQEVRNDIALAQLDRSVNYNNLMDVGGMTLVRPICIPTLDLEKEMLEAKQGKLCYLSGHGETNNTFKANDGTPQFGSVSKLQKGVIPVYSQKNCKKKLMDKAFYALSKYQICAYDEGVKEGEQIDACQGDSGGPFVCPLTDDYLHPSVIRLNKIFKKKGSSNWPGNPMDRENKDNRANKMVQLGIVSFGIECGQNPGVYTKVSQYENWIKTNMAKYSGKDVETSFQLIDVKGKVIATKSSRSLFDEEEAKPVKYCQVNKTTRKNGSFIKTVRGIKALIVREQKGAVMLAKTGRMKSGWVRKKYCTIIVE